MSKFNTSIPVNIDAVMKLLPRGANVNSVILDPKENCVRVIWDHHELRTPYTFPVEFPLKNLEKNKLPAGVIAGGALKAPEKAS